MRNETSGDFGDFLIMLLEVMPVFYYTFRNVHSITVLKTKQLISDEEN